MQRSPMEQKAYQCEECGKEEITQVFADTPDCCGKPMKEIALDDCTKAYNPESARLSDVDEACDDGVH